MPPRSLLAPLLRPLRPHTPLHTPRLAPRILPRLVPHLAHRFKSTDSYVTQTPGERPVAEPTTFSDLDVFADIPPPASSVSIVYNDAFLFSNGVKIDDGSGALLVHNEVFKWQPVERRSIVEKNAMKTGLLELGDVWGMLDVVHPKPELLIVGTGRRNLLLSKEDRSRITELGIRMDVMSTRNAAAQYNLLAVERLPGQVACAMLIEEFGKK